MAFEDFKEKLKDTNTAEHKGLLKHVLELVSISRKTMSENYAKWDEHDAVFRSKRKADKEDRNADAKGAPRKVAIPLAYSQILTFVAFNVMTITQNRRFYELEATGTEDSVLKEPIELILERDLRRNQWNAFLVQFFLDVGRFSLGVGEVCYTEEFRWMRVEKEESVEGPFGMESTETTSTYQQIPTFVGNKVYPISPYRWLPDTRLPLTRYQEGEFCGSEDMFSMSTLRGMESDLFNLNSIPKMEEEKYKERRKKSRIDEMPTIRSNDSSSTADKGNMVKSGPVVITKMVFDLIPKHFEYEKGKTLGKEGFPVRYIAWVANDQTIVRFEEAYYLHGKFPYFASQFLADQHQTVNEGLSELCEQLAGLVTWKWNAHIASQRNSVDSRYIVDPAGVDMRSLESRSPYIFLKKTASQTGVDRYIKQFITQDVTQNIMSDSEGLKSLLESITGFTAQMQGQYSAGRRSATQDRVVAQGASARGKVGLAAQWDTGFECLGRQLIANNRQEMDFEDFQRVLGKRTFPTNPDTGLPYTIEEVFALFKADAVTIARSEDFFVFDATNPSEKAFLAQSLQEILMELMSNPAVSAVLGYGPDQMRELFNQIYILRGVTPPLLPSPQPVVPPMVPPGQPVLPELSGIPASMP